MSISVGCYKRNTTTWFLLVVSLLPACVAAVRYTNTTHNCISAGGVTLEVTGAVSSYDRKGPLLPLLPPSDHVIMITAITRDKAAAKSKVKSRCFWFLICYTICRERASA